MTEALYSFLCVTLKRRMRVGLNDCSCKMTIVNRNVNF